MNKKLPVIVTVMFGTLGSITQFSISNQRYAYADETNPAVLYEGSQILKARRNAEIEAGTWPRMSKEERWALTHNVQFKNGHPVRKKLKVYYTDNDTIIIDGKEYTPVNKSKI